MIGILLNPKPIPKPKHLMKESDRATRTTLKLKHLTLALAAIAALLAQNASADTTITTGNTVNVTDPNTWSAGAGAVTIDNGGTLQVYPSTQNMDPAGSATAGYIFPNAFTFAGGAGTINLQFADNDTFFNFTGTIASTATGAQTLAITTGISGGDREAVNFHTPLSDSVGAGNTLGIHVTFHTTSSGDTSYVNLIAVNTFTGPITLSTSGPKGCLVIGGERYERFSDGSSPYNFPGSGNLGNGAYSGAISLDAQTILDYKSSVNQTLSGVISGAGQVVKDVASSTLTLSGANTYTGNTTVNGGTVVLDSAGGLQFTLTDTTVNKVTGAGTATINGKLTLDTSAVTVTSGSWPLVATTTKSFGGTFGLTGFTGPVGTVFTKVDGYKNWTFDTSTGVLTLLSKALITSFAYNGLNGVINNSTFTINLPVAHGTSLATVAPTFTVSSGTCNQTSASPPSPTFAVSNPATYTLTDTTTTPTTVHNYAVTATVLPASPGGVGTGLKVWLAGDAVNPADPAQVRVSGSDKYVTEWYDWSGYNHFGTNTTASQQPLYITNALNGKPVLRFTDANSTKLYLGDLSASFWGVDPATNSGTGGSALNGTYVSSGTRGVAGALVGDSDTAVTLDGSSQDVDIPYNAQINTTIFSAEIWAKPANSNTNQAIFSSGQPAVNNRTGWVVYQLNGSNYSFRPFKNSSNLTVTGTANGIGDSVSSVTVGQWQHIVVVNDGTNCILYVNGAAIASASSATYVPATDGGTTLGKRYGSANLFAGSLDEAAFYTTALSPTDVLAHYQNGINPTPSTPYATLVGASTPVGYYRLDEAALTKAATIFAVATINSDTSYNLFGNCNNDDRWLNGTVSHPGSFRGAPASGTFTSATWPIAGPHIYSLESSTAQYRGVIDGTEIGTDTADYNAGSGQNWTIGDRAGGGQQFNGDIAELLIYNRVLTTQETKQVGAYLSYKYGVTTPYTGPYGLWAAGYLPADVSNPAADNDGDGLSNFQEYAFGLDPTKGSSCNPLTPLDKTSGMFSYTRRNPSLTGLTYHVFTSTDLQTWTEEAYPPNETLSATNGDVQTMTVTVAATPFNGKLFVRVEAW